MNNVWIEGNLGRDAEIRATAKGLTVASFSVAVTVGSGDKKATSWIPVTAFGKLGEKPLKKGDRVMVSGYLKQNSWEKDGKKHYKTEVIAASLAVMGQFAPKEDDSDEKPFLAPFVDATIGLGTLNSEIPF